MPGSPFSPTCGKDSAYFGKIFTLKLFEEMHVIGKVIIEKSRAQIREQMSVPDLYVLTVAFLALKKLVVSLFRTPQKISKIFFIRLLCNFSVRTL